MVLSFDSLSFAQFYTSDGAITKNLKVESGCTCWMQQPEYKRCAELEQAVSTHFRVNSDVKLDKKCIEQRTACSTSDVAASNKCTHFSDGYE